MASHIVSFQGWCMVFLETGEFPCLRVLMWPYKPSCWGFSNNKKYVAKRIVDKIYELVKRNITNIAEVKRCLDRYIENKVFEDVPDAKKPKKTNQRYYPCCKDLRNRIAREISAQKYSDDDQEYLCHKKSHWQEVSSNKVLLQNKRQAI